MATNVLDVVTFFRAFDELERRFLGTGRTWGTHNAEQEQFFAWYATFRKSLRDLRGLVGMASTSGSELNAFLAEHQFDPMFDDPLNGIGGVGIIHMLVNWLMRGTDTRFEAGDGRDYAGFDLPKKSFEAYNVQGYSTPLVRLLTAGGTEDLWALQMDPIGGFPMLRRAFDLAARKRGFPIAIDTLRLPVVDLHMKPDVSWLTGADVTDRNNGYWFVAKAAQEFKFRWNAKGAKVDVAGGVTMRKGGFEPKEVLTFDYPFMVWTTQRKAPTLPIAVAYIDFENWMDQQIELEAEAGIHHPEFEPGMRSRFMSRG